eukprot:gb/GECG01006450.1/.p1 GENE.gb/GECG01006450.1/~~gb/GECG01006450.1/.p1  ORF type:complete len:161 (+),score=21.64 gb/GECG01006450.1/:1-483(+)
MLVRGARQWRGLLSQGAQRLFSTQAGFNAQYGLFVNGKEIEAQSGRWIDIEDPATTHTLTRVAQGDKADVDYAVQSAEDAFARGDWSRADVRDRAEVMEKAAEALQKRVPEFAELESLQTGRPIREMKAQLGRLPEWFVASQRSCLETGGMGRCVSRVQV